MVTGRDRKAESRSFGEETGRYALYSEPKNETNINLRARCRRQASTRFTFNEAGSGRLSACLPTVLFSVHEPAYPTSHHRLGINTLPSPVLSLSPSVLSFRPSTRSSSSLLNTFVVALCSPNSYFIASPNSYFTSDSHFNPSQ